METVDCANYKTHKDENDKGIRCKVGVHMNNVSIANQTISITNQQQYTVSGNMIHLPEYDYKQVMAYTPQDGEELLQWDISDAFQDKMCQFRVINADSFQAAREYANAFVMNFANAHNPGGGFKLGANAQEEALCRCSTLYASITSKEACMMYLYNNTHLSSVESDYMLYSPNVCVFRNEKCELLEEPFQVSVITLPAPNRFGAAMFATNQLIAETMTRRIRIMLRIAANHGHKNLVLGAWGCGAFGNKPEDVSGYFKKVLVDEEYGRCFDEVCFAIYGRTDGKNIKTFRERFDC